VRLSANYEEEPMTNKTRAATVGHLAVIAVLGLSGAACSSTDEPPTPTGQETPTSGEEVTTESAESTDTGGSEGGEVDQLPYTEELNGKRLTIKSFGTSTPAHPEMWEVPEGYEVVYLEALVENVAAEPWESNAAQFFLYDPSGEDYATTFYDVEAGEAIEAARLEVGDSVEGFVAFEVPAGTTGLRLEYAVNLFEDAIIRVQLS
jgi:hypothetical protein